MNPPPLNGRVAIRVYGLPVPQGSKGAKVFKGRATLFDTNAQRLDPWREHVKKAAEDATRYHDTLTGPLKVWVFFTFQRPKSHYRTGRNAHLLRDTAPAMPTGRDLGDVDKLQRAVFDSLTEAQVWADDCLVVDVRARKVYAGEDEYALDKPGVSVIVEPLTEQAAA